MSRLASLLILLVTLENSSAYDNQESTPDQVHGEIHQFGTIDTVHHATYQPQKKIKEKDSVNSQRKSASTRRTNQQNSEMDECTSANKTDVVADYSYEHLTSIPRNVPENVTELYLYVNDITDLPVAAFRNLIQLEILDVSDNKVSYLDENAFVGLENLRSLFLTGNRISDTIQKLSQLIFHPLINLCKLDLRFNRIEAQIPGQIFIKSKLKFVNLGNNRVSVWSGTVVGAESIEIFTLTNNDCFFLESTFFANFTGLKVLGLGHNQVGTYLDEFLFYNLTNLEILDLSNNGIQTVSSRLFLRLRRLEFLDLSGNGIISWEASIYGLTKLEVLDLSRNTYFHSLPLQLCTDLDHIRQFTKIRVRLEFNKMRCTCETQHFIKWINITQVTLDWRKPFCNLLNGTKMALSESDVILQYLDKLCRSYITLIACLSAVLALALCIVIVGLVRRYRWKLRYLYYMAVKRGERTGYLTLDGAGEDPFAFDAFVSYEDEDRDFIKHSVLPKLEREEGLRLCIDRRDFTPGLYITENIMNAIQKSRKTVVLLSKEFLKSKWCMYEMNMARMENLYNERETLVIVMMEELDARDLTAEVLEILHSQSYIEKTDDPIGENIFWRRLATAIK